MPLCSLVNWSTASLGSSFSIEPSSEIGVSILSIFLLKKAKAKLIRIMLKRSRGLPFGLVIVIRKPITNIRIDMEGRVITFWVWALLTSSFIIVSL